MAINILAKTIKSGFLFFILFFPGVIFSQIKTGKVLSDETNTGIAFVNIGVIGKDVGTVSDEFGNFTLNLDKIYDKDSIRFSIIGYKSKAYLVGYLKEDTIRNIYLSPRSYYLTEVKVFFHRPKKVFLGSPVTSNALRSGFEDNELGSELGIFVEARKQVRLQDINLNIAVCTYDSVTYRINIYQAENDSSFENILTRPIYISFTKDQIDKVIKLDLTEYSIEVEGKILITLELYKDMGKGRLLFHTQFFTGYTYHRKTSQGRWTKSAGLIGMYLHSLTTK